MLGIVSPASTPKPDRVAAAVAALERLRYRTKVSPHAPDRGPLYYAGRVEDRLADFHSAFSDDAIDAVICTRGGWGSAELLPLLERKLLLRCPKPFIGYSDMTSLHTWLLNEVGLVSFHGPMVAADFSKPGGADLGSWAAALGGQTAWQLGPAEGLRVLQAGTAEGMLTGGCLAIYAEALGTAYAPRARGGVLFLEDIGVKPYQWDRMLLHLRYAGLLDGVTGIVFGDMAQSCPNEEQELLEAAVLHALRDFRGPIAIGLRSGHVGAANVTLPFGVRVRLECEPAGNPRMHFLEAATEG